VTFDLLIRGCRVVTPRGTWEGSIGVRDGRIAALGRIEGEGAREVVDAVGLYALPGAVDPHVHMMDPGYTEREDWSTGTAAAAVGGVTTVIDHHRSDPVVTTAEILREKAEYVSRRARVDFALIGGAVPDNVDQLQPMWEAGAVAFKAFTCGLHGQPAMPPGDLLRALRAIARFDGVCLVHAEDDTITARAREDARTISDWRCPEAEVVAVATVIELARLSGARVILAHQSLPENARRIRAARREGVRVWAESCPQYFYLDPTDSPWNKFTPPARGAAASEELWACLRDGDVDYLGSDHCPYPRAQKDRDVWEAPFGIPGVETAMRLMLTGVSEGRLSLERLVECMAETPARLYGLYPRKGHLGVGADADVVLVDLAAEGTFRDEDVVSRCGWTPYRGRRYRGAPVRTYVRGRLAAADGRPVAEEGTGQWVTRG
jgi:allantoinase